MLPECPANVQWSNDGLERDLYIQTKTVTVLAMDGRRRWLDIQKLVSLTLVYLRFALSSLNFNIWEDNNDNHLALRSLSLLLD